jgi:hypothetical protein
VPPGLIKVGDAPPTVTVWEPANLIIPVELLLSVPTVRSALRKSRVPLFVKAPSTVKGWVDKSTTARSAILKLPLVTGRLKTRGLVYAAGIVIIAIESSL